MLANIPQRELQRGDFIVYGPESIHVVVTDPDLRSDPFHGNEIIFWTIAPATGQCHRVVEDANRLVTIRRTDTPIREILDRIGV